ncbi:hypothetical protein PV10_07207 [Exophiala mesophila]|uniref:Uncharacterized protein n=1 Tax=Exophiala mesophila TaxID=212818 RepID=A0A0D1XP03_EXOME|nr:uncharacterized protein PV10_07207 [Exophiala mesophila]KIV89836.1 hypothetical protein PV10_07207 [Exophiala mesophila]
MNARTRLLDKTMGLDRTHVVGYATTLLHTHQLRRENVLLHGRLQSCEEHIDSLRDEVKSLTNDSNKTKEKLQELLANTSRYEVDLGAQNANILRLEASNESLQKQVSSMSTLYKEWRHDQEQLQSHFDEQINKVSRTMQRTTEDHQSQMESLKASLGVLTSALEEKADIDAVARIQQQLRRHRSVSRSLSPTLSRVLDSIEDPPVSQYIDLFSIVRGQTENIVRDQGVQVCNSQPEEQFRGDQSGQGEEEEVDSREPPRQSTTIPDDLDLDANAETSSYAGHHHYSKANETPLTMLPELAADPSELAKINTLHQMRFETWEIYHQRAQRLLDNLPSVFGDAIMRQFVDGMFREVQRRQCQQFLEKIGWKWDNITAFGAACSQLEAETKRPKPAFDSHSATAESVSEIPQSLLTVIKENSPRKVIRRKVLRNTGPVRRSQRLLERAGVDAEKEAVDVATQNEESSVAETLSRNTIHGHQIDTATPNSSMAPAEEGVSVRSPKLVSGKRGPSLHLENDSDSEVLLPSMKRMRRVAVSVKQIAINTRAFDQPPPPEIPILSTTTEE